MIDKDLDTRFLEAVEIASKMTQASLPQDVQLRLYAFYKHATYGTLNYNHSESFDLRNAFKTNAWIQIISRGEKHPSWHRINAHDSQRSIVSSWLRRYVFCRSVLCFGRTNPFSLRPNTKPVSISTCSS